MKLFTQKQLNLSNSLTIVLGFVLVFIVPWFVPFSKPVISDSYNMGFNNKVGILGVGLTILLLIAIKLKAKNTSATQQLATQSNIFSEQTGHINKHNLRLAILIGSIASLFVLICWILLPLSCIGETRWFIPNSELMLLGQHPYTQFQFNYGPIFLYFPIWLVHLFGNSIGVDTAYIITLMIFTMIGILFLSYITTPIDTPWQPYIFAALAIPFIFNADLGLQYTALRFTAPYVFLIWLHHATSPPKDDDQLHTGWHFGIILCVGMAFCFLLSPDSGLAFFAASTIYTLSLVRGQNSYTNLYLSAYWGIAASIAGLCILVFSKNYLQSISSFGQGGNNYPLFPMPHILFYLTVIACVVPALVFWGLKKRGTGSALALAWAVCITIFIAPALGHCDPGHIFVYGLGAFIGAAILLQNSPNFQSLKRIAYIYLLVLFSVGVPVLSIYVFYPRISMTYKMYLQGKRKTERLFWKAPPLEKENFTETMNHILGSYSKIGTPLGVPSNVEIYLKRTGKFVPEYFTFPAFDIMTQSQIIQKNHDIEQMHVIIVPQGSLEPEDKNQLKIDYGQGTEYLLRALMIFPLHYIWRNDPLLPRYQWNRTIQKNFIIKRRIGSYYLMVRNS